MPAITARLNGPVSLTWISVGKCGVDGKAEEHKLDDRQAYHHREGDAVAPHLDEFLDQHGKEPVQRQAGAVHCPPAHVRSPA